MKTLNDPLGCDEAPEEAEWTPAIGLRRGALNGLLAAAILSILLVPLAAYLPYMIIIIWLRAPLAFGVAWVLCQVVQRGAGMVDVRCTLLALVLAALVLASSHVVFAVNGVVDAGGVGEWWVFPMYLIEDLVPQTDGYRIGWQWCHPYALLSLSALPLLIGGGFCAALCNRG